MIRCRSALFTVTQQILVALLLLALPAGADWPQFLGPNRDGVSPETGLARTWPASGPKTLWRTAVHEGFGGPAICDSQVFVLDRVDNARDILRCLDLESGNELWTVAYDAPGSTSHNGSRTTPTVTATHIFVVGLMGHFTCVSRTEKAIEWQVNLKDVYGQVNPKWGFAQSPVLYKDLVIVAPQSPNGFVAAYRQDNGDRVWVSADLGSEGYSSPRIATLAGVEQVVMVVAPGGQSGSVHGLSLDDGHTLWSYDGWECRIPIPNATPLSDDRLFITGEYGAGSAMIRIARNDNGFSVKELFTTDECESQIHQPLIVGDVLFANSNGNKRADGMICMTLDGRLLWRTGDNRDLPQFERGNLIFADGMILNLDGRTGYLHLIAPATTGYQELSRAKVLDGQKIWSPMALSNGKLVLRSQDEMKCLDLRNP